MLVVTKTLLYLATITLIGTGMFYYFVQPGSANLVTERSRVLASLIATLTLLLISAAEIALKLYTLLGFVDLPLYWDYLQNTRHGNATMLRIFLTILLASVVLIASRNLKLRLLFAGSSLGLLATFSWTSHGAAMGGTSPLLADLIHFASAACWAGPLVFLALSQEWHNPAASQAYQLSLARISQLGLVSVISLFLSGLYSSLIHLANPESFVRSPYALALYAKLVLVFLIVGIASINRFKLLPSFLKTGKQLSFRRIIRIEALLLLMVFAATALLSTSALPHGPEPSSNVLENAWRLLNFLRK